MNTATATRARSRPAAPPDDVMRREAALALYRQRAARYDLELTPFEPLRRQAIERLALQPGETVLDLGCGTGLSFEPLLQAVGPQGRVVGVEQCPEMLAIARGRIAEHGLQGVELRELPVECCPLQGLADAAMFHFTHDILQDARALSVVLGHLRPGARVVATGLQWAPPWSWAVNWFVWGAAWYSVASMRGLDAPWRLLAEVLPGLQVESLWQGAVYMAHGRVPG